MLSLSNNKITKNYTSSIFLVFFASIISLSIFMYYMPTTYSQTEDVNGDGIVDELDTQTTTETTETPIEDVNGDGVVDELDTQTTTEEDIAQIEEVPAEELTPPEEIPLAEEKLVPADELETPAKELVAKSEEELQALEEQQQAPVNGGQQPTITAREVVIKDNEFCDKNSATLQVPAKGDKVVELQTFLSDLGFLDLLQPEGIDGKFGPHTKNAVIEFQKFKSLTADGIVGPKTWAALCSEWDNLK